MPRTAGVEEMCLRAIRGAAERRWQRSSADDIVGVFVAVREDEEKIHGWIIVPRSNKLLTTTMLHHRLRLLLPILYLLTVAADEKPCTIHHGNDFFDLNKLSARYGAHCGTCDEANPSTAKTTSSHHQEDTISS